MACSCPRLRRPVTRPSSPDSPQSYWRLDLAGRCLGSHELADGEVYRETGRFDDEVTIDVPVTVRFRLADLLP